MAGAANSLTKVVPTRFSHLSTTAPAPRRGNTSRYGYDESTSPHRKGRGEFPDPPSAGHPHSTRHHVREQQSKSTRTTRTILGRVPEWFRGSPAKRVTWVRFPPRPLILAEVPAARPSAALGSLPALRPPVEERHGVGQGRIPVDAELVRPFLGEYVRPEEGRERVRFRFRGSERAIWKVGHPSHFPVPAGSDLLPGRSPMTSGRIAPVPQHARFLG